MTAPLIADVVISEAVWQSIIAAVMTVILAWMSERTKRAMDKGLAQARAQMSEVIATGDAVHMLVNSAMSKQLAITSDALDKVAKSGDAADVQAAADAGHLYREHEAKQRQVDNLRTPPPPGGPAS